MTGQRAYQHSWKARCKVSRRGRIPQGVLPRRLFSFLAGPQREGFKMPRQPGNEKRFGKAVARFFRSVAESVRNARTAAGIPHETVARAKTARVFPTLPGGSGSPNRSLVRGRQRRRDHEPGGSKTTAQQLVITFDGPLNAAPANPVQSPTNTANYSVQVPSANPEMITSSTSTVSVTSATTTAPPFRSR